MSRLNLGNRKDSPCHGCKREWKKPGCHDICPDFADYKAENAQIAANRNAYMKKRFGKYWYGP